jgi:hypothetical protein
LYNSGGGDSSTGDSSENDSLGTEDRPIRLLGPKGSTEVSGQYISLILSKQQLSRPSAISSSEYSSASERCHKNSLVRVPGATATPMAGDADTDGDMGKLPSTWLVALEAQEYSKDKQAISSQSVEMAVEINAASQSAQVPVANVYVKSRIPKRLELLRSIPKQQDEK